MSNLNITEYINRCTFEKWFIVETEHGIYEVRLDFYVNNIAQNSLIYDLRNQEGVKREELVTMGIESAAKGEHAYFRVGADYVPIIADILESKDE